MANTLPAWLITIGVVACLGALVGGGISAAGFSVPVIASRKRQAALGVAGLAIVALGLRIGGSDELGPPAVPTPTPTRATTLTPTPTPAPEPTSTPTPAPPPTTAPTGLPFPGPMPSPAPETAPQAAPDLGQCELGVTFEGAMLLEEPSIGADQLAPVPVGTYIPTSTHVTDAGVEPQEQLWFQIAVDGRSGWIPDGQYWLVKSIRCP